jgi:hypothetical protein
MLRTPIQFFFHFGTVVRYLQDARPGHRIKDDADGGRRIRTNLRMVFNYMTDLDLKVSPETDAAAALRELLAQFTQADDAAVLTDEQFTLLDSNINSLRTALESELQTVYAYAQSTGGLPTQIEDPSSLLAATAYARLPENARVDIAEAAQCLTFALPTAAAFHLTRAVETVLQAFYVSAVSARRKVDHTELFDRLDRIRSGFRNPLQSSETVFNIDEAQRLWELSVDVINRIAPSLDPNASGRRVNLRPQHTP